ncbi:hypothetical protein BU15DRAFT_78180 [Melanogaster broomeanus]|nr:hypothetical protein BU15DRAFT_78180 [Melanogaster broomeanus]
MAHHCVDWTSSPPTRKTPLLILNWGNDHVYTTVPKELRSLEGVVRKEFGLGNVELEFSSSCVNLCNGVPARISESVWEHIRPYIGCVSVAVRGLLSANEPTDHEEAPAEKQQALTNLPKAVHSPSSTEMKLASYVNKEDANDHSESEPAENDDTAAPEHYSFEEPEEAWEEEVSAVPQPKSRRRRRVVSEDEDEDEGNDSEKEQEAPPKSEVEEPIDRISDTEKQPSRIKSPVPPDASPPELLQPLSRETKKEQDPMDYRSQSDSQSTEPPGLQSRPIKQEKKDREPRPRSFSHEGSSPPAYTQPQSQSQSQTQNDASESQRIMIRVAHRASKQESKFTIKSSTKVAKLISGACKSFGLDATRAALYLIVSMEDEGGVVENLFPCDRRDTMARAGAEQDAESKFLLKLAGDP